eukprot:jgi/Mesen1/8262/ME000448S07411
MIGFLRYHREEDATRLRGRCRSQEDRWSSTCKLPLIAHYSMVLKSHGTYLPDQLRREQQESSRANDCLTAGSRWGRMHRMGSPSLQAYQSAGQHDNVESGYIRWPYCPGKQLLSEERAAYFLQLQNSVQSSQSVIPAGRQACSVKELMIIRAYHSRTLRRYSLGTALGLRTRGGKLTNLPAIIVFVSRKVHEQWLLEPQKFPTVLHGPGSLWCDIDVVEFSSYGPQGGVPREQVYCDLVDGLRGKDPEIGPGSQVASEEMYGTFGAVVKSRREGTAIGFLTNRHVAVDFDQPRQKMYHPLPPSLGPGLYLGSVERASSFSTDHAWYGIFAGQNPETYVRADGAFIPFREGFDMNKVTPCLKGMGEMGSVYHLSLDDNISSLVGRHVIKLGGSSGLTYGVIMAYAVEYNDDKGVCFFTDFLILGENDQPFDMEGDSGSFIVLRPDHGETKYRPVGIIWGGTANRGRLKIRSAVKPENWTSGIDLGRLLDLLDLDLITNPDELNNALVNGNNNPQSSQAASEAQPKSVRPREEQQRGPPPESPLRNQEGLFFPTGGSRQQQEARGSGEQPQAQPDQKRRKTLSDENDG